MCACVFVCASEVCVCTTRIYKYIGGVSNVRLVRNIIHSLVFPLTQSFKLIHRKLCITLFHLHSNSIIQFPAHLYINIVSELAKMHPTPQMHYSLEAEEFYRIARASLPTYNDGWRLRNATQAGHPIYVYL